MLVSPLAASNAPSRVMSLNVCTDQLAMALAAPDQLVSVSYLARDPELSVMHEEAAAYPVNRGRAEEVFLARPDAVVTGTYSLHNTTGLIERLGIAVEEFDFTQTLDTIPGEIRRMGDILGRQRQAETKAREFEDELAAIEESACGPAPTAIAYGQNGVALAAGTLADSALRAAGFKNLAADLGYSGMVPLPLELLVENRPDAVIVGEPLSEAPSLADRIPRHPAIAALPDARVGDVVPPGAWSCGGPFVIEAVRALAALREEIAPCNERTDDGAEEVGETR